VSNYLREAQLDAVDLREQTKSKRKRSKKQRLTEEEEEKKKELTDEEETTGKKRKRKTAESDGEKDLGHRRKRRKKEDGSTSDQYDSERDEISGSQLNVEDIDFSVMEEDSSNRCENSAEHNRRTKEFKDKMDKLDKELKDMFPNFKADDQYESLANTYNDFKVEREKLRERLVKATEAYEKVKKRKDGRIYENLQPCSVSDWYYLWEFDARFRSRIQKVQTRRSWTC